MRYCLVALALVASLTAAAAQTPTAAVVRIESHGASATVIESGPGRSLLLSAAHPWRDLAVRTAPIVFTAPAPQSGPPVSATHPRVVKIDYEADLALVEVQTGPLPYVLPVAKSTPPGPQRCRSVGFDLMRWPAVDKPVTILGMDAAHTYTREPPVEGRSGGPLVCDGQLVGVVVGYETAGQRRGIYVSLRAIKAFLAAPPTAAQSQKPAPAVHEERIPTAPALRECPDGRCPVLGKGR